MSVGAIFEVANSLDRDPHELVSWVDEIHG